MAKIYIDNINSKTNPAAFANPGTPYVNPFQRMDAFPLDRTELFDSYDDAVLYASGSTDSRKLSGTSYPGQIISVVSDSREYYKEGDTIPTGKAIGDVKSGEVTVTPYQIQGDGTLKAIGSDAEAVLNNPWEDYTA